MLLLWTALAALAGGGGLYIETTPGAAWTDATGPITRGVSGGLSAGAFWGPYKATIQYGRYQRAGLNVNASSAAPFRDGPESIILSFGPEFGGGIDLLKAGAYWRVVVSPAVFVLQEDIEDEEEDAPLDLGLVVRASGAAIWWFDRRIGIVGRIEAGPNYRIGSRSSLTGGIGVGFIARAGFVRGRRRGEPEVPFDPDTLPWEEVPPEPEPQPTSPEGPQPKAQGNRSATESRGIPEEPAEEEP
ncbi:MAG: hypothetical protein KTR31_38565 [Myxococcales bacterium]|nr:hypothetical protein [Myxococcales bacterium]